MQEPWTIVCVAGRVNGDPSVLNENIALLMKMYGIA